MKSDAIKELETLAITDNRKAHPTLPDYARCIRKYSDKTANGLTTCIIDFLRFKGWQAERINCTGRYQDNTKVVEDVTGFSRRIGSAQWLPTSGQKGTADISATIKGKSVKIEVKMKDRQSEAQKEYQRQVEQAGGLYWLVRSFDEFMSFYNSLM